MDSARVTLHEHFAVTGCCPEVTVYLEGWM
jgi:hypothetical protein